MSTKALQALVEWAERGDVPEDARGAREELEAIEKAAPEWLALLPDSDRKEFTSVRLLEAITLETAARESAK